MTPSLDNSPAIIGCETHSMEFKSAVTGIERVVTETHRGLFDLAPSKNLAVARVHTSLQETSTAFREEPSLASDPVLRSEVVSLEDIAALLILDMSPSIAWRRILEERAKRHLPVVFMVHDVLPLTNPEWFTGGENARRNFRVYIQQGLFAADVVIVASEMVKTDLENLGWRIPGRIVVVPLGSIHTPRPPSQEVNGRISMLSVTTLEPRKGHSRLLDAFDILRSQNVDVDLTLVGRPGWNSDDLFRRIRQHEDFGGRLTWFPSASDQRVISYAAQSNIGVLPADGEGFGMFFEEALSLGLKVVASDIPVFREREQKNVFYAGRTGAEFAAAILNAANTSWKPFRRGEIRSMRDFAGEIQDVILEEISRGSGNSLPAQTGEV